MTIVKKEIVNIMYKEIDYEGLIVKYGPLFIDADGGIFTDKARMRLMNRAKGREKTKNDFWYDRRNNVAAALIDLRLFIEASGNSNVNQVLTVDSIEPVINTYFQLERGEFAELGIEKINIALYLISACFEYLTRPQLVHLAPYEEDMMKNAIAFSNRLGEGLAREYHKRQEDDQK